jgi:nucleoid-associated protein YgaU
MRTDAKIGFAIGGVLLAVLTVYAIVVPKHKKTAGTVSLVTPASTGSDSSSTASNTSGTSGGSPAGSQTPPPIAAADSGSTAPAAITPLANNTSSSAAAMAGSEATTTPSLADNLSSPASTDGFHPLSAPSEMPKADDQPLSNAGSNTAGKLVDGVYTPEHSTAKLGRLRHNSSSAMNDDADNAVATSSGDTLYTIKSGQTLSKIAYEVYGNSRFWVVIQRENKGLDANHLKVGSKVKLPDISTVVPGPVTVSDEEVAPMMSASSSSTRHRSGIAGGGVSSSVSGSGGIAGDGRTYTVKSGDSLYAIAKRLLGSGRKADSIYALNKDVIGPDKSKLKLGEVLKLPEGVRTAQAS